MSALRRMRAPTLAFLCASVALGLACSSSAPPTAGPGPDTAAEGGASQGDGGAVTRADSAVPQTSADPPPAPTSAKRLVDGEVFLLGVTSDNFVIYVASTFGDGPLHAVSLAGGAPIVIAPFVHYADVVIQGKGVAFWTNVALNPLRGNLNLWTLATGVKANLGTSVAGEAHFSDDGARVAVLVNPQPLVRPPTVDVAITSVAAPSLAPVLTGFNTDPDADLAPTCAAQFTFVGSLLYVTNCTAASPRQALFRSVTDAGLVTTIIDNVNPALGVHSSFMLDAAAQKAFFLGTNREARVFTIGTGATTVLDTDVVSGWMSRDGTAALFVKEIPPVSVEDLPTFSLRRSPTTSASPVTLYDTFGGMLAVTPDLASALFTVTGPIADGRSDLYFVDTTAPPSSPLMLAEQPTTRAVGFTGAGTHMLYLADVGGASGAGKLKARSVSGPGVEREFSGAATGAVALPGTKVVFCERLSQATVPGDYSTCDIASIDAAASAPGAVTVQKADPYFFTVGTKIVFALMWGPSRGVYVKDAP